MARPDPAIDRVGVRRRAADSAVDLVKASCFRSFESVNGLRPPEAAREARH